MAQYTIDHTCGHSETVQIYGTNVRGEREDRAAWLASRLCRDCYRDQQTAQAQADADDQALPALQGSDKQIAWGLTLRAKALISVEALLTATDARLSRTVAQVEAGADVRLPAGVAREAYLVQIHDQLAARQAEMAAIRRYLAAQTDARFWIDHRGDTDAELVNIAAKAVRTAGVPA